MADDILLELLSQGAPSLKRLDLIGRVTYGDDQRTSRFDISENVSTYGYPHVKSLTLYNLRLPWTSPPFSGLSFISLNHIKDLPFITLWRMLINSPSLNWLRLNDLDAQLVEDFEDKGSPEIKLSNLKVLILFEVNFRIVKALLSAFRPPSLGRLHIRPTGMNQLPYKNLPSFIPNSVVNILRDAGKIIISIFGDSANITPDHGNDCEIEKLDLTTLSWWLDVLNGSHIMCHELHLGHIPFPLRDTLRVVDQYRSITKVILYAPGNTRAFFNTISDPLPGGRWPLPRLSSIELCGTLSRDTETFLIGHRLGLRYNSSSNISALSSLSYQYSQTDPFTVKALVDMASKLDGCRIYRTFGPQLYEEWLPPS